MVVRKILKDIICTIPVYSILFSLLFSFSVLLVETSVRRCIISKEVNVIICFLLFTMIFSKLNR